jgi:hypothetical protein
MEHTLRPVANPQFLAQFLLLLASPASPFMAPMARAPVVTFHVYPVPIRGVVTIMVAESGKRFHAGEFEVTAGAWERMRRCLTPGPDLRIREYPP